VLMLETLEARPVLLSASRFARRLILDGAGVMARAQQAMNAVADRLDKSSRPSLARVTREIGDDWKQSAYYDMAEKDMERLWNDLIWPLISDCDFSVVVDLAAGHGRNTEKLRQHAGTVYVADINRENIDYCRRRFQGDERIKYVLCDGTSLKR